ncbi:LAMI_0H07668g1_1 [Lachancea mirantina]|uniref:LAMI_0H07668g1_1 n=1 Tax=Lachancea mirantina TaxID=1230905 RepID=A0A1G4KG16_9SACH|nr:LAMI_0H07668g1_1 [Lachancea mirantina]
MSGSFWKFGQNNTAESPLSKLLNQAFLKVKGSDTSEKQENQDRDINTRAKEDEWDVTSTHRDDLIEREPDNSIGSLPDSESDYKDYAPNLGVLDELLDDEELYTELMCSNFKLLIYFKYPEVLAKLVDYVTNEHVMNEGLDDASDDANNNEEKEETDKEVENSSQEALQNGHGTTDKDVDQSQKSEAAVVDKYSSEKEAISDQLSESSNETGITLPPESEEQVESRRARMAAEILSADVWPISSAFMDHEDLLSRLWAMLDHSSPLSIVASTYFMKINERLLDMDIAGMLHFILSQDALVDRFLRHIDNPPLMDFLLKVISTDKPDNSTGVIDKLKFQNLISKLLDYLSPEHSSSTKSAAGDFLKALITISANSNNEIASAIGPNELTRELVSPKMVEKLINIMLNGGTSLSNGVGIIIELIRKNNSDYDFVQVMYTSLETHPPCSRDPIYLGYLVKSAAQHLPDFNRMLLETKLPPLETPFGSIEPLGFERFKICELVAELLHCSNMTLLNEANGEQIVTERDRVRERSSEQDKTEEAKPLDHFQVDDENLNERMAELALAASESNQNDEGLKGIEGEENSAREIHSEDSSDSEVPEKILRDSPVVGDQLKITLQDTHIITTILQMFFKFPWNNFLHNVVFDIVQQIFNGPLKNGFNRFLIGSLFAEAHITEMIIEGDKKCEDFDNETGLRLGYMGHLTLIAEEVAKFAAYIDEMKISFSNQDIADSLNKPSWKEYTETVLADTRENYSTVLGDFGDDDDEEEREDLEDEGKFEPKDSVADNDLGSYVTFEPDRANEEEYAEYSDLDSPRYYEYDDNQGNKATVHLNPNAGRSEGSHTLSPGYDQEEVDEDQGREQKDKFSSYMSHQLSKDYSTSSSSDDDEEDAWGTSMSASPGAFQGASPESEGPRNRTATGSNSFQAPQFELQDDDDDYMDPNDDGQSYAKPNHPLYNSILTNRSAPSYFDQQEVDLMNDSDDSDNDDPSAEQEEEEEEEEEEDYPDDDDDEYSLCRTSSKDNMSWNDDKKNNIIDIANYRQSQRDQNDG